ncbi:MAG: tetratricopeptide repeat protein [Prolixibacteraceae bacterium]|jgi:tetratricopeptide (TPR) repeat protein
MRRINLKPLAIVALATVLLSSCASLQKMKKNANLINFKTTPEILETNAGKVDVAIDGKFPAKYFNKKATMVATPVLKYDGGEKAFEPVTLQGEKVDANNKVITLANGGSFAYKDAVPYQEAMRMSDLELRITASKGAKSVDFAPISLAKGVIATPTLVVNYPTPIIGVQREKNTTGKYDPNIDEFQRIVPDEYTADIKYLINKADIRKEELTKDEIAKLKEYNIEASKDPNKKLKSMEISSYASPDGTLDFNTKLAEKRQDASSKFLTKELKKDEVEAEFKTKFTPEDWDGFKELMGKSNIQDKELILRVLSMYTDPEVREREIKNLSGAFTSVASEILPQLRRSKFTTSIDLIGKSDEEIASLADSDPSKLNPAELLYAATLTKDLNKKLAIYNSASKIYSSDWRGFNNAGMVLVKQGKYDDAKGMFEKAEKLKNDEPIVKNNLGVCALKAGELDKAETLFGAASGAGDAVNNNLGILSIIKGDYAKAVKYFGDSDSPNTGLAKILAGDNNGALKSLENCTWEGCYMKEYFKAIVGARTAKENLMYESLAKAIEMHPELKKTAASDMEFAKYFNDQKFKDIVK